MITTIRPFLLSTFAFTAIASSVMTAAAQATPQAAVQAAPPVTVGARVRVWAPAPGRRDAWLVGTVTAVDSQRVELREERSGDVWTMPFANTRMEVSRGVETARYGGAAGALGGFLVGEVLGFLLVRPAGGSSTDPGTRAFERLRSAPVVLVGVAGASGGFFIGRRIRGERWEPVMLPVGGRPPVHPRSTELGGNG